MINTTRLRCMIGWLGIALPILVLVLSLICGFGVPASVSITYFYYPCIAPFMVILGAAGILLMCYYGYDRLDDWLNTFAGAFGIGVCLFPTYPTSEYLAMYDKVGMFMLDPSISSKLHNICAVGFFGLLIVNSLFLFTKSSGEMTKKKKIRNVIYRVCGIGMLASIVLLAVLSFVGVPYGILIGEALALLFFGFSWLTKADYYPWLACDDKNI